jgi:DNA-binding response OmpR family regulator
MAPSRSYPTGNRVLVIEDEPFIAALFAEMVHELGYEASGLANGLASARRELGRRNFDVVLLDIGLDGQHSPELADLLMEMKMPFAFVTGYTQPFELRHSQIPLLHKPFTLAQLRNVLNALIGPPTRGHRSPSRAA